MIKKTVFPLYCDDVYTGQAESIQEAWNLCL